MSMNEEEFASFLWALENTGLAWAVDDLRARDTAQREALGAAIEGAMKWEQDLKDAREALARVEAERDEALALAMHYGEQRNTALGELAEAVGLLEPFGKMAEGKDRWPETSGVAVFPLLSQVRPVRVFLKRIARHAQADQQEAQGALAGDDCKRPPEGWTCSRAAGHEGPCAASATDPLSAEMQAFELMGTWTGEDWTEMAERFPALAEQIEGVRRAALATQSAVQEVK